MSEQVLLVSCLSAARLFLRSLTSLFSLKIPKCFDLRYFRAHYCEDEPNLSVVFTNVCLFTFDSANALV